MSDTKDLSNLVTRFKALWADIDWIVNATPHDHADRAASEHVLTETRSIADDLGKAIKTREPVSAGKRNDEEMVRYLSGVEGTVEANRFEHSALWRENSDRADGSLTWTQGGGYIVCVGKFSGYSVHVSLLIDIIDGHKILFYYPTSQFIDLDLVDKWIEDNIPDSARDHGKVNNTDASNFHNVLNQIKWREKNKETVDA
jgi:hypothetical protein